MAARVPPFHPAEERDQLEQAEIWYNAPLRAENQRLSEELKKAKQLLRENGIAFPSTPVAPSKKTLTKTSSRVTRRSRPTLHVDEGCRLPDLPLEIQFIIVEYAMSSNHPIIDPLMPLDKSRITSEERTRAKNQIAIGCMAACRAFHEEGRRAFWNNNTFIFTTHQALRQLGTLDLNTRNTIKSATLRIVGQYYDDEKKIRRYDTALVGFPKVKVSPIPRVRDNTTLSRKGFKSYTWLQVADFLNTLRPPFDPLHDNNKQVRPRLLPSLASMRIDFVNFPDEVLDFPGNDVHFIAAHDLARTLDELMFTGLPMDDQGYRIQLDLEAMVRDDGLFVRSIASHVHDRGMMRKIDDAPVRARVVRSWRSLVTEKTGEVPHERHGHWPPGNSISTPLTFSVPLEKDHPQSLWKKRPTMWRRVPASRDSVERDFVEFSRTTGFPIRTYSPSDDEDDSIALTCEDCGELHEPHMTDADIFF